MDMKKKLPAYIIIAVGILTVILLIPYAFHTDVPAGTKDYVLTRMYGNGDVVEEYQKMILKQKLCEKTETDDMYLHIYATEEQRQRWVADAKKNLDSIAKSSKTSKLKFLFNDTYDTLYVEIPAGTNPYKAGALMHQALFNAELYQIFSGNSYWNVHVVVDNVTTGERLIDVNHPMQEVVIDPEKIKKEKTKK